MELNTAASVITYITNIEKMSADFYDSALKGNDLIETKFSFYARENRKIEKRIKRVYYGVVSDALETGFSFRGLRGEIKVPKYAKKATISGIIKVSIEMEQEIHNFYLNASQLSKSLLADVPRVMSSVAKIREKRILELKQLLNKSN